MHPTLKFTTGVYAAFGRHHANQAASAIAYQTLFAILPLTGLLLASFGFILHDPEQQRKTIELVLEILPLQSNAFVTDSIRGIARQRVALTAIGLLGFVWTASGLLGAIRDALNVTWQVRKARGFVKDKLIDLATMFGLGVLLIVSLVGTVTIHLLQTASLMTPDAFASQALLAVVTVAGVALPAFCTFICFMVLYRFVPNVKHCARDVWVGATVATLMFEFGKHGFAFFVTHFSPTRMAYGVLGDVMLFMLWTWVSASILLIGAEVSAELHRLSCGRAVEARSPEIA